MNVNLYIGADSIGNYSVSIRIVKELKQTHNLNDELIWKQIPIFHMRFYLSCDCCLRCSYEVPSVYVAPAKLELKKSLELQDELDLKIWKPFFIFVLYINFNRRRHIRSIYRKYAHEMTFDTLHLNWSHRHKILQRHQLYDSRYIVDTHHRWWILNIFYTSGMHNISEISTQPRSSRVVCALRARANGYCPRTFIFTIYVYAWQNVW